MVCRALAVAIGALSCVLAPTALAADGSPSDAAPARRLSLAECVERALRENLDLAREQRTYARTEFDLASARAAFLPTLSASATHDEGARTDTGSVSLTQFTPWGTSLSVTGSNVVGSTDSTPGSLSVTLSQPLLRGAGPSDAMTGVRQSELRRRAAEARLARASHDIVYRVKTQYYDAARLMETVKVRRQAVERASRLRDEAAFKRDRGLVTVLDHANAVIQLADRESALVSAEKQLEDALDDLKETLRIPVEQKLAIVPIALDLDREIVVDRARGTVSVIERPADGKGEGVPRVIFQPVPRDYEETIARTLERRPDLIAARHDLEVKRLELARKRNQLRHDVRLSATYTAEGGAEPNPWAVADDSWSAGVTFTWPLGRVSRRADLEAARLDLEMQEIAVEKLVIAIRKEVLRLFRRLEETEINILSYALKIGAGAQALESAKIRKERGQTSYWEVTARESDLLDAQTSFINAYLDYQKRLAELERACGGEPCATPGSSAGSAGPQ